MSEQTLRVMCPNLTCRKILAVPTSARGKTVRCRGCQTNIKIPAQNAGPEPKLEKKPEKKAPDPGASENAAA